MRTENRPEPIAGTEAEVLVERLAAFLTDAAILAGLGAFLANVGAGIAGALLALVRTSPAAAGVVGGLAGGTDLEALLGVGMAVSGVLGTLAFVAYFVGTEGLLGRTPGKQVMGLVVVREDGGPCGLRAAAVRNLLRPVDSIPSLYLLGLGAILATDRSQRLGDLAADTVVVRAGPRAHRGSTASPRTDEAAG